MRFRLKRWLFYVHLSEVGRLVVLALLLIPSRHYCYTVLCVFRSFCAYSDPRSLPTTAAIEKKSFLENNEYQQLMPPIVRGDIDHGFSVVRLRFDSIQF